MICSSLGRGKRPPVHYGEKHHKATLTDAQVIEIRHSDKMPRQLARQYGVSEQTIYRIRKRETRSAADVKRGELLGNLQETISSQAFQGWDEGSTTNGIPLDQ